ncbi:Hpt domain-containing protein [Halochromatium sp.]
MIDTSGDARLDELDTPVDDHFSIAVLVERLDGDQEIAREVAAAFVESSQELLQQLDGAIAAGRADAVRRNAHSIKGAAANIGANALAETAAEIEDAGRDQRLELAERLVPQLHRRIEHVFAVLKDWL